MVRYSMPYSPDKNTIFVTFTFLLLILLPPCNSLQAGILDQQDQLLQLTAAGYVLGFKGDVLYVAGGGHVLNVDFVKTAGVVPKATGVFESGSNEQPLTRVAYTNLWSGVNLLYEATTEGIAASTWEIAADADVNQIRLRYNAPLEIMADGSIKIRYKTGWINESKPIAWQTINGNRYLVDVIFCLLDDMESEPVIGFKVGHYDPNYSLLIDPTLTWNTFLGSSKFDSAGAIALDANGNIYVTGYSNASWGAPVNAHSGGYGTPLWVLH